MKILGVFFCTVSVIHYNWQSTLAKLAKALNLWKARSLSFIGKALIENISVSVSFFHLARFLSLPAWVLARANQLVWNFFSGLRIGTVSRNTCSLLSPGVGGLSSCNLRLKRQALSLSLLFSIISNPDDSSFFLCKYFVGHRLSSARAEWGWLRDMSALSAASPTPFSDSCLRLLPQLSTIAAVSDLSSRTIYSCFLSPIVSSPVLPFQWSRLVPRSFSLDAHWSLVRDGFSVAHCLESCQSKELPEILGVYRFWYLYLLPSARDH